ncbi:hypothetical protein KCU89_g10039, partial [Aureobasidium melanogenum]
EKHHGRRHDDDDDNDHERHSHRKHGSNHRNDYESEQQSSYSHPSNGGGFPGASYHAQHQERQDERPSYGQERPGHGNDDFGGRNERPQHHGRHEEYGRQEYDGGRQEYGSGRQEHGRENHNSYGRQEQGYGRRDDDEMPERRHHGGHHGGHHEGGNEYNGGYEGRRCAIRASIALASRIASTTQNSLTASAIPDLYKMFHIPRPDVSIGTIEELDRISDRDISISPGQSIRTRSGSRGDAMRGPPPSIVSLAIAISSTTLGRLSEAAQDYGHLNHFFREADEAFADEMTAAYDESRTPIPLLIPLDNGLYIPCYAVLLNVGCRSQTCWDTYHRGLMTIMQRVAREMGVSAMLPVVYLRETFYDDICFQDIGNMYMREREVVSAPVLEGDWPQDFSSTFNLYT